MTDPVNKMTGDSNSVNKMTDETVKTTGPRKCNWNLAINLYCVQLMTQRKGHVR